MCTSKPKFDKPTRAPRYALTQDPDNAALYEQAQVQAAVRGGGPRRNTILTGLRGTMTPPMLAGQTGGRSATALG